MTSLLGIPLPTKPQGSLEDNFLRTQYWRLLFSLPIVFAAIQSALLFTVFNFETPKFLKQNEMMTELNQIMRKIYSRNELICRIDGIVIN